MENEKINKDSKKILLEELFTKVRNDENITEEEFIYCINGFYEDFKNKIDEMTRRVDDYKLLIPPRVEGQPYLPVMEIHENRGIKVSTLNLIIKNAKNEILKSIDMILEYPESKNIRFLLSQKELFDDYYDVFSNYLEAFLNEEDNKEHLINRFYLVKDKMRENQKSLKK